MADKDSIVTGELLKETIRIVDELAKSDFDDVDYPFDSDDFDYEKLQKLIGRAKKITKNRLWILK